MSGDPYAELGAAVRDLKQKVWAPIEELITRVLRWLSR